MKQKQILKHEVAMCPNGHYFSVLITKTVYKGQDYVYCRYCKRSYNKDKLIILRS